MDGKNLTIAYVGGGSMNFGWKLMGELAGDEQLGGLVKLYDVDKQLALANEVIGNRLREEPSCKGGMIYLAVDTLDEALRDADFVIVSINPGSLEEMVSDIHLPEMFGIYQSVGESAGPGGVVRAVRTLPVFIELGKKISSICPEAWVINLTNPMNGCLETLYKVFPKIKAFGCSNAPFSTQELLAELATMELSLSNCRRQDVRTNLMGINNFAWFTEAHAEGKDLMPTFQEFALSHLEGGYERRPGEYKNNLNASANMVKFDMFSRYEAIAAAEDRHIAEFCPPWYLKNPKVVANWKFNLTSVNYMKKRKQEKLARQKRLMSGEETLSIAGSGTECVIQMKAILGLHNIVTNADLPNQGQVSNLPLGSVVQTNALFSRGAVQPVMAGSLPEPLAALTLRHISNAKTVQQAVWEKDLDMAFNAFLNDPLLATDLQSATELYKEMLSSIRSHLLYYC